MQGGLGGVAPRMQRDLGICSFQEKSKFPILGVVKDFSFKFYNVVISVFIFYIQLPE